MSVTDPSPSNTQHRYVELTEFIATCVPTIPAPFSYGPPPFQRTIKIDPMGDVAVQAAHCKGAPSRVPIHLWVTSFEPGTPAGPPHIFLEMLDAGIGPDGKTIYCLVDAQIRSDFFRSAQAKPLAEEYVVWMLGH